LGCFYTPGGGIFNDGGKATLQNSIVTNNQPNGLECSGTITSHGYNLGDDNGCAFDNTGDLIADPKLGKLGNNGGPTQTIPLLSGSPAIDAGNPRGCTDGLGHLLKTEQRGMPRLTQRTPAAAIWARMNAKATRKYIAKREFLFL
jgi:hypothetical protein